MSEPKCRLYVITPPCLGELDQFSGLLAQALQAGHDTEAEIACVQLRLKNAKDNAIIDAAKALMPLTRKYGAAFLINDRPDLAKMVDADGVHLGQGDAPYQQARALLGPEASIGITCHGSRHLAMEAGEAGADYVAFGAFYSTTTKQVSEHAHVDVLSFWSAVTTVPCVAIGGITPENAAPLVAAGADFLAVSGSLWQDKGGPAAAMARFAKALSV